MLISEYINLFEHKFNAKVIPFHDITNYFSCHDMYGENVNIETLSEGEIASQHFSTLIIDGHSIDSQGNYDWGTKAIIIFVEFDKNDCVINACILSSFFFKNLQKEKELYRLLECYHC